MPIAVLLVAPAQLDNALTVESFDGWRDMRHAPWTGVETAMSFRELYLPRGLHAMDWQQNPLNFPDEVLEDVMFPPTFNLLMGVDLFLEEGKMLTNRLRQHAVVVDERIFPGFPHMALGMGRMFPELLDQISQILRLLFTVDSLMYTGTAPPEYWMDSLAAQEIEDDDDYDDDHDDDDECQCHRSE